MDKKRDYNPDQPFEGLGFIEWCKVVFRTRAQTLRHCDIITHKLFLEMNDQQQKIQKLARLVQIQNAALEIAADHIDSNYTPGCSSVFAVIAGAVEEGKQTL